MSIKELQDKIDDSLFGEHSWTHAEIKLRESLRKELSSLLKSERG